MQFPAGSLIALSSAASTVFSIGMIFLGYWGISESGPWKFGEVAVAVLALGGFVCLGLVPWLATTPTERPDDESKLRTARRAFLIGVAAMWTAIVVSLFA
jgi:quinol-cytochrome oxidoreductase complex cytochrome b subunit